MPNLAIKTTAFLIMNKSSCHKPISDLCLQRNQRTRQASHGTIEKDPHTEGFGPLNGHQANLPANMIAALEMGHLRFIPLCIPLQARDSFLDGQSEPGTDFKAFRGIEIVDHRIHLWAQR
jgi:hypothetical protein